MNNMVDNKSEFLKMAINAARENVDIGGGPFGAVIVKEGEIISSGANKVTQVHDPTAHAEIVAIREACKKLGTHELEGCIIYSSTEPCPMCLGAIYWAGIKKIVFASDKLEAEKAGFIDAHIYREMSKDINQRELETEQLKIPGSGEEFKAWISKTDKESY